MLVTITIFKELYNFSDPHNIQSRDFDPKVFMSSWGIQHEDYTCVNNLNIR